MVNHRHCSSDELYLFLLSQEAEGGRGRAGEDPAAVTHREVMSRQQRWRRVFNGQQILLNYSVFIFECLVVGPDRT